MDKAKTNKSLLELFDLATGYQRAKVLFALIELEIPTLLAKKEMSAAQLAKKLKFETLACDRLLNAGVALGLLEKTRDKFHSSSISNQFLIKTAFPYLGEQFLRYNESSYPLWSDLTDKLREWKLSETDETEPEEEDQGGSALAAQHNYALLVAQELNQKFDFKPFKHLLDLGGGTGAMSIGICRENAHLSATIFDLPQVTRAAKKFIKESKLNQRIQIQAGNFKEDDLPINFDVALLANLLSVASEEINRQLFKQIYEKLPVGGAIILSGWILDDARTSPLIPVLFCLEDIVRAAPDVERTKSTYISWLEAAGFKQIKRHQLTSPSSIIVGRKG